MTIHGTGFKHVGQHDTRTCYPCKLQSLIFDTGGPKTHVKNGDHWNDNPVVDRIMDLKETARRLEEKEAADAARKARELAAYQADQGVTT
jgi:hypothetical protein